MISPTCELPRSPGWNKEISTDGWVLRCEPSKVRHLYMSRPSGVMSSDDNKTEIRIEDVEFGATARCGDVARRSWRSQPVLTEHGFWTLSVPEIGKIKTIIHQASEEISKILIKSLSDSRLFFFIGDVQIQFWSGAGLSY
jgi:hypothetical protein